MKAKIWSIFTPTLQARGSVVSRHLSIQEDEIDPRSFLKEDSESKPLISVLLDMLDVKVGILW